MTLLKTDSWCLRLPPPPERFPPSTPGIKWPLPLQPLVTWSQRLHWYSAVFNYLSVLRFRAWETKSEINEQPSVKLILLLQFFHKLHRLGVTWYVWQHGFFFLSLSKSLVYRLIYDSCFFWCCMEKQINSRLSPCESSSSVPVFCYMVWTYLTCAHGTGPRWNHCTYE